MLGYDGRLGGWNVDADLMALHTAAPAIQLVDLTREPWAKAPFEPLLRNSGVRVENKYFRLQLLKVIRIL